MTDFARPRKALGQNFLTDENIITKIVDALNIQSEDEVIEIGPGRGALTNSLISLSGKLHLIEFDKDLISYWTDRAHSHSNLEIHGVDVLKFDFAELFAEVESGVKVIGNLPYNISSPVLFRLMEWADYIDQQLVMLQKEVVERMTAQPGSKQYGRLSVMLQQRYNIEMMFKVPPTAFYPPPKVDSAIARLSPLKEILHPVHSQTVFEGLVKQAFSMRRKTLKNNLKGWLESEHIQNCGIDPAVRAETLSVAQFTALANLYHSLQ